MKTAFVTTSNVRRFLSGLDALERRGSPEACWLLLTSPAGLGKTTTVHWWAMHTRAIYLRAKVGWTPAEAMADLVNELGGSVVRRKAAQLTEQATALVGAGDPPRAIVIDEVEHCLNNIRVLEAFRDISDIVWGPVIVVGMPGVKERIQRHEQISSRITQVVEFAEASDADVDLLAAELAGVALAPDLLAQIQALSRGRNRLIMDAMAAIERHVRRNRPTTERDGLPLVTLADLDGIELCNDWRVRARRASETGART